MSIYNEMGKMELRAACKENGIKGYGKMNNDGMRAALNALNAAAEEVEEVEVVQVDLSVLGEEGIDGHCPHCKIGLDNGIAHYEDICESDKRSAGMMEREWVCLACDNEWGAKIVRKVRSAATGNGLKIEKDREERNGIKRPSVGGACRAVWDVLDEMVAAGETPTAKMIKVVAAEKGWNANNASIEFYQWRKFNGIRGRQ